MSRLSAGLPDRHTARQPLRAARRFRYHLRQQAASPPRRPLGEQLRTRPSRLITWWIALPSRASTRSVAVGVAVPLTGSNAIDLLAERTCTSPLSFSDTERSNSAPPLHEAVVSAPLQLHWAAGPV